MSDTELETIKKFKAEAEKIPNICGAGKCLFEIDYIYSEAGQKYLEMRRSKCPCICPKYRGSEVIEIWQKDECLQKL